MFLPTRSPALGFEEKTQAHPAPGKWSTVMVSKCTMCYETGREAGRQADKLAHFLWTES